MSKLRENLTPTDAPLASAAEGDLRPFVVFTQLVKDGPFVYAGWVDAADRALALQFAREHYGQDQECTAIWIAPREHVAGMRVNEGAEAEEASLREYRIFVQAAPGDAHVSSEPVTAKSAAEALAEARRAIEGASAAHSLWAIPRAAIAATTESDLIWRYTDQSYRLARGYSRDVRRKWEEIRERQALEAYERDDLQETF